MAIYRATLVAALLVPLSVSAATIHVPTDVDTIQAAIDLAAPGDTVLVAPGTYLENLVLRGRDVVLESEGGPDVTIVDGQRRASVLTIPQGSTRATVVRGFTLRNGDNHYGGSGIAVEFSSPTIVGNHVVDNVGCSGVGIDSYFGSPLVQGNVVARNVSTGWSGCRGGGLHVGGAGTAEILDNDVTDNRVDAGGGGIGLNAAGSPVVAGNRVLRNQVTYGQGGGFEIFNGTDVELVQNLVAGNRATSGGGGIVWTVPSGVRGPRLVANTIAQNDSPNGAALLATGYDSAVEIVDNVLASASGPAVVCEGYYDNLPPAFRSNVVWAATGVVGGGICPSFAAEAGNVSADPLFEDAAAGAFRVRPGSPAIDAGDGAVAGLPPTDLSGGPRVVDGLGTGSPRIDVGAYEYVSPASPASVAFGDVLVYGTSAPVRVLVRNDGAAPLTVYSVGWTLEYMTKSGCGAPVPGGGTCPIDITFSPRARGARPATVTIITDRWVLSVPVNGRGVAPRAVVSPAALDFGPVLVAAMSAPQIVTVTNTGDAPLTSLSAWTSGGPFAPVANTCTGPVAPGASCTVAVEFGPTAHGTQTGALNFASDSLEPTPAVALVGTGLVKRAGLSVDLLDFGIVRVGETHSSRVVVTSVGEDPVTILDVAVRGPFGQTNDCAAPLAPGATCNIWVTFTPTDRVASWGDLSISTDGVYTSGVRLQGRGGVPIASITPAALTFEKTHVGKLSQSQTVLISNGGDLPLQLGPVVATGDFAVSSECGAILYPSAGCLVWVWFSPSTRGVLTGQLVVESDSAEPAPPVQLTGTAFGSK